LYYFNIDLGITGSSTINTMQPNEPTDAAIRPAETSKPVNSFFIIPSSFKFTKKFK